MPSRPYFFRRPNLRFTPGAATLSTSTPAPTTPRSPLMRVPPRRRFTTSTREGSATTTSQVILSSTTKPRYKFASRRPYLKTTSPSTSTTSEEDPNDQILDASNQKPMKNGNLQDIDSADEEIASSDEVSDIALTIHSLNAAPLPTTRVTTTTEKGPTVTTLYDRIKTRKRGRISTTMSPHTTSPSVTNRRRRPQPFEKVTQVPVQLTTGSYTPITVEYDYYDEGDVRILGQLPANSKVLIHSSGAIQCLDQGNFPHPISCHKFISCAKMENNDVIGWEYTCPNRLSFDPVGGICNWSAGIGCKEN